MAIFEKLLIRWHLTSKAIGVASPLAGLNRTPPLYSGP
jgi:hypothetical protein